jgi:two-component system chemotaxis response regulator CheB
MRVLLADDSLTMRAAMLELLKGQPGIEVVGEASDGAEAIAQAKALHPDVITMDVQMPRVNGIEAISTIMSEAPSRIIVVCAVSQGKMVDMSLRATSVGALEVVAKPEARGADQLKAWGRQLAETIRSLREVPVVKRRAKVPKREAVAIPPPKRVRVSVVGIVSSTGGPAALATILKELPKDFPVPILIAQHLPNGFGKGLVRWFSEVSPMQVFEASDRLVPRAGCVYLPPDGRDLIVDRAGLLRTPQNTGELCPSADKLLSSIAEVHGSRAMGIVLTGMGRDGAQGLLQLREAGGVTIAQDAATSVVYGMPKVAAQIGAAMRVLALPRIIAALQRLTAAPTKTDSASREEER